MFKRNFQERWRFEIFGVGGDFYIVYIFYQILEFLYEYIFEINIT